MKAGGKTREKRKKYYTIYKKLIRPAQRPKQSRPKTIYTMKNRNSIVKGRGKPERPEPMKPKTEK